MQPIWPKLRSSNGVCRSRLLSVAVRLCSDSVMSRRRAGYAEDSCAEADLCKGVRNRTGTGHIHYGITMVCTSLHKSTASGILHMQQIRPVARSSHALCRWYATIVNIICKRYATAQDIHCPGPDVVWKSGPIPALICLSWTGWQVFCPHIRI